VNKSFYKTIIFYRSERSSFFEIHNIYIFGKMVCFKFIKPKLLTFIFCVVCLSSYGQTYIELKEQAEQAYNSYDIQKAIELGEEALKKAEIKRKDHQYDYAGIKNDLGIYYVLNGEVEQGLDYLEASNQLILEIKGEKSTEYIEKLNNLVSIYYMLNDYQKALNISNQVLTLSESVYGKQHNEYAYALNSQGLIFVVLGKYTEAEQVYLRALSIYESDKKSEEYPSVLNNIGDLYISMGNYEQATEYLLIATKNFEKNKLTETKSYSDCLFTLGKVYKMVGEYESALLYYSKSGEILKKILGEQHEEYATTLSAQAAVYEDQEKYIEAEQWFLKALDIKKKSLGDNNLSNWISANNLSSLYIKLERYSEAKNIIEPIVINSAPQAANFPVEFVSFSSNLALVYQHLGNLAEAGEMYESILKLQEAILGEDHHENVVLINNMAGLKIEQEKFQEADLLFDRCLKILEQQDLTHSQDYVDILYMKGLNLMNMSEYLRAKDFLFRSINLADSVYGSHHKMYATISINMGVLLHKINDSKLAEEYFIRGMNAYQKMVNNRISFMSLAEKEQLKKDIQLHFSFFKQFVLDHPSPKLLGALYDYHLMLKAMIINSKVKVRKEVLASNNEELQQLFKRWVSSREMLNKLYSFSTQNLLAENVNIDSIAFSVKLLEDKIALQSSSFNDYQSYGMISWKEIQQKLKEDEAAIEIIRTSYYGGNDPIPIKYIALVLTAESANGPQLVVLEEGRKMENEWIDDFYYELFMKRQDSLSYGRFWGPILTAVVNKDKLYISRTGVYNVLNINTFMNPETKKYALEENDIVLVGNTRDIVEMKNNPATPLIANKKSKAILFGYPNYYLDVVEEGSKKDDLLAMSNLNDRTFTKDFELISDLPGTKKEVENINSILSEAQWETTVYIEDDASENKLKSLKNPGVLHIATHGFFDWQYEDDHKSDDSSADRDVSVRDPLYRSGLMMAGSGFVIKLVEGKISLINNLEDGVLSAYEVVNMDLSKTELVVLSACLSGVGETKVKETESFSGLPQAFIIAGAKAVVTSGWSVDDRATQELMTLFYKNLANKYTKREALRRAQITLMEKFPQPFFWGPFTIIGQ